MIGKLGLGVVVASAVAQALPTVPLEVNWTLTGVLGVGLMVGKVLQQQQQMRGDVRRLLHKVFPEEYADPRS